MSFCNRTVHCGRGQWQIRCICGLTLQPKNGRNIFSAPNRIKEVNRLDALTIGVIILGVVIIVGGIVISHISTKATLKDIENQSKEKNK